MEEWTIMLQDRAINKFSIEDRGGRVTIGRGSEADVVIDNAAISREHLALELVGRIIYVHDLGSTNGTFVNGQRIKDVVPVSRNDDIEFGKFRLLPVGVSTDQVSSSSTSDMDHVEETVFISAGQAGPGKTPRGAAEMEGPKLIVRQGKAVPTKLSLVGKTSIKIGKDSTCDMIVKAWFVASAQCYIVLRGGKRYSVVPQWSWSATRLNGLKIKEEKELHPGDIIEIRDAKIQFES